MSYNAFFSHSNEYKSLVEEIAIDIEDNYNLQVWLDKWSLIAGDKWVQEIQKALINTKICVVFIGKTNSTGWYENEVELALNIESKNREKYRIIPVLLPDAEDLSEGSFLSTRTLIDLRDDVNREEELYKLSCGIQGVAPGRFQKKFLDETKNKLQKLKNYYNDDLITQEVLINLQSKILEKEFKL